MKFRLDLNKSAFGHRNDIATRDNEVIQNTDVNQGQSVLQSLSNQLVGLTGLRNPRRMLGFVLECHLAILASRLVLTSA
jgi:hypothetical protein